MSRPSRTLLVAGSAFLALASAAAALVYWRCTAGSWRWYPEGPARSNGQGPRKRRVFSGRARGKEGGKEGGKERGKERGNGRGKEGGKEGVEVSERSDSAGSLPMGSVSGRAVSARAALATSDSGPAQPAAETVSDSASARPVPTSAAGQAVPMTPEAAHAVTVASDSAHSVPATICSGQAVPVASHSAHSVTSDSGYTGGRHFKPQDAFKVRLADNRRAPFVHLRRGEGGGEDRSVGSDDYENPSHPYGDEIRRLLACPPPPPQHLLSDPAAASWRNSGSPEEDTLGEGAGTGEGISGADSYLTEGISEWATQGVAEEVDTQEVIRGESEALGAPVWVDTEEGLQRLAAKLEREEEFAVDTEQHSLHSFLGFTALLQVSTRDGCDYIVDAMAVHDAMACLRPAFADPGICKVFHGADSDVLWLQRDFHIYTVNLFDTARACTVLQKPQRALAYLLHHYCSADTDKRLQTADWRTRPLPQPMLEYAQNDTHYLLRIADALRRELLNANLNNLNLNLNPSSMPHQGSASGAPHQQQQKYPQQQQQKHPQKQQQQKGQHLGPVLEESGVGPRTGTGVTTAYLECLRRSNALCLQLYDKDLSNPTASAPSLLKALRSQGLYHAGAPHRLPSNPPQSLGPTPDRVSTGRGSGNAASGSGASRAGVREAIEALLVWRDAVARREDESPRYVLPDTALLSLAVNAPTCPPRVIACVSAALEASMQKRSAPKPSVAPSRSIVEPSSTCKASSAAKSSSPATSGNTSELGSTAKPSTASSSSSDRVQGVSASLCTDSNVLISLEPNTASSASSNRGVQGGRASVCTDSNGLIAQEPEAGPSWVVRRYAHELCSLLSTAAPPHHSLPSATERTCSNPRCTAGTASPQDPQGANARCTAGPGAEAGAEAEAGVEAGAEGGVGFGMGFCSCRPRAQQHPQDAQVAHLPQLGRGASSGGGQGGNGLFWVPSGEAEEVEGRNPELSGVSSADVGQGKSTRAGRGWLRHRDPEQARANFIKKFSCRGPVYENCRIYSGDGRLLCYCDKRKLQWYLARGLAEYIPPPSLHADPTQEGTTEGVPGGERGSGRDKNGDLQSGPTPGSECLHVDPTQEGTPGTPGTPRAPWVGTQGVLEGERDHPPPSLHAGPTQEGTTQGVRGGERGSGRDRNGELQSGSTPGSENERPRLDGPLHVDPTQEVFTSNDLPRQQGGAPDAAPHQPLCIRLLFEPKGTPLDDDNEFYVQSKRNQCVACGESSHYLRYRLVPSCYRQSFPEHLKSHRSHDIVLLCVDCHEVAHKAAEQHKHLVAAREGVPLKVEAVVVPLAAHSDNERVSSDNIGVHRDSERVYSDNGRVHSDNGRVHSDTSDSQKVDSNLEEVDSDSLWACNSIEASNGNTAETVISTGEAQHASAAVVRHGCTTGHPTPEARPSGSKGTATSDGPSPAEGRRATVGAQTTISAVEAQRAAVAVVKHGHTMPEARHRELMGTLRRFLGRPDLTPAQVETLLRRDRGRGPRAHRRGARGGQGGPRQQALAQAPACLGDKKEGLPGQEPGAQGKEAKREGEGVLGSAAVPGASAGSPGSHQGVGEASRSAKGSEGSVRAGGVPGDLSLRQARGHQEHGKRVVERLLTQGGEAAIKLFITEWREVFVDAVCPRFLPSGWNVHHSGTREFGDYSVYNPQRLPPQSPAPGHTRAETL